MKPCTHCGRPLGKWDVIKYAKFHRNCYRLRASGRMPRRYVREDV